MKKKAILLLSTLAVIVVPLITRADNFNNYSIQALIFMPMRKLYDAIIYIGTSGNLGNTIAWLILVVMSLIPLVLIYYFKRSLLKEKGVVFVGLSVLSLVISIMYFGNNFELHYLGSEVVSRLAFVISSSMWYFTYFILLYEMYLRNYEGADEAKLMLSVLVGIVVIYLVVDITMRMFGFVDMYGYYSETYQSKLPLILNGIFYLIKRILVVQLLLLFNDTLLLPVSQWFEESFIEVISRIKKVSKRLLSFAIYYPVLQILIRFIGLGNSTNPSIDVVFPYLEIMLSLVIIVVSEIIMYGIRYKEDSESFV